MVFLLINIIQLLKQVEKPALIIATLRLVAEGCQTQRVVFVGNTFDCVLKRDRNYANNKQRYKTMNPLKMTVSIKMLAISLLAVTAALFASHTFVYNSGINSVTVAVQADALDTVAKATEATKVINTKDSDRYATLAKNHKSLESDYGKLLQKYRDKVKPDDAKKFDICTYDTDTLQLLLDSASGGKHTGSAANIGSGFNGAIPRATLADYWYTSGNDRAHYRERQAFLQKPVFAVEFDRSYERSPGSGIRA